MQDEDAEGDDGESDEGAEDAEGDDDILPISHEIILKDHTKVRTLPSLPSLAIQRRSLCPCALSQDWLGIAQMTDELNLVCSAVAVDPSGARVATGGHDCDTNLWDFGGMDSRLKPFKSFEVNGNTHVNLPSYLFSQQ